MSGARPAAVLLAVVGLFAAGVAAYAQEGFFGRRPPVATGSDNVEYNGQLTFVRIRYNTSFGGFGRRGSRDPGWLHDYPTADLNLMQILGDLSVVKPRVDGSNILTLDDPELFKYPIAYMSEPGGWVASEPEALGLRHFLLKGGFIIFDDFRGFDFYNLEEQMRRVLPDHRWIELDLSSPIFHSFFDIQSLDTLTPYGALPRYYGMFEDNDPRKRMLAVANRDGDMGEYWEYSATGFFSVDLTYDAYKFGVNYMIYGLTH